MAKWFLVMSVVLLTGTLSGCQKKAAQEEASIPVEEAIDAATAENQEIAQSDEMAAVSDAALNTTQTAVQQVADTAATVAQTVVNAIPTTQDIQTALKNAGFYQGAIDGNIGPRTKQAIKDFQFKNSLTVDGKVGPKTWKKLSTYLAQVSNTAAPAVETAQEITEVPAVQ